MSALSAHLQALANCRRCPTMHAPVVVGRPVPSQVLLIGQAPGGKEPVLGRPFAWTAGKTLFRWLQSALGWDEETVRSRIYFAAVCRCFPGKDPRGGDRLPTDLEIQRCSHWLRREFELLRPKLVLPVGRLAISQFLSFDSLADVVGKRWTVDFNGATQDFIPLPHPSGASTWHRTEPGKTLLENSLRLIAGHPAIHRTERSGAFESCDESGNG